MEFWRYREVLCGRDREAFDRAKGILEQNGIVYRERLVGSHDILGVKGTGTSNIQYYLYVEKKNAETAEYLLRR